jgi:hypothetical protein
VCLCGEETHVYIPRPGRNNVLNPAQLYSIVQPAKMKFTLAALALPIAVQAAHYSQSEYESGAIHQKLMKLKTVWRSSTFCYNSHSS